MPRHTVAYDQLPTEQLAPGTEQLDLLDEQALVDLLFAQDLRALAAVGQARREIAGAAAAVARALGSGGRLIYVGAGTSGRLAAGDAAECPPTFGTHPGQVIAVLAGGNRALGRAVEGAEDSRPEGRLAVQRLAVTERDLVCGVSASGVTPFVRAALDAARRRGAATLLISCAPLALVAEAAEHLVCLAVGPETLAGSTRMKSGLATKAVLHTLSTVAMIRLGKVHGNLMVEVSPTSRKLRRRAARIVSRLTGLPQAGAIRLLRRAGGRPKVAAVMHCLGVDARRARELLAAQGGRLRPLLGELR